VAVAALLCSTSAPAGYVPGHELSAWCRSQQVPEQVQCLAYLQGAIDTLQLVAEGLLCMPEGLTARDAQAVYLKYLEREQPAGMDGPATGVALNAFVSAWRCPGDG